MENIKAAVMAVCAVSAAAAVISQLTAGTKNQKQIKFIMDMLVVLAMTAPFVKGYEEFSFSLQEDGYSEDYDYDTEIFNESFRLAAEKNIAEVLAVQLKAAGIEFENIEPEINILPDNSISIIKVTVTAEDAAAAEIIRQSLGSETEVVYELS